MLVNVQSRERGRQEVAKLLEEKGIESHKKPGWDVQYRPFILAQNRYMIQFEVSGVADVEKMVKLVDFKFWTNHWHIDRLQYARNAFFWPTTTDKDCVTLMLMAHHNLQSSTRCCEDDYVQRLANPTLFKSASRRWILDGKESTVQKVLKKVNTRGAGIVKEINREYYGSAHL